MIVGCNQRLANKVNDSGGAMSDGVTGDEIWGQVRAAYSTANSYHDKAVLYLSYRMNGQVIQEPQPWSFTWDRSKRFAATFFNSQIHADGRRLGCYVYDIDSANLDNQWLLIDQDEQAPLARLLDDPLARYFVGGFSELPLDEGPTASMRALLPPTVDWLNSESSWSLFESPRLIERLKDASVDERSCYHLKIHGQTMSSEVWIDRETKIVRQMTLPVELLDGAVRSAVEVSEIQFFARMHEAAFNGPLTPDEFSVSRPREASPVQQFVTLPEAFPCETIGKTLPPIQLVTPQGVVVNPMLWTKRPTVLLWISGLIGQDMLLELDKLVCSFGPGKADWAIVYSDEHTELPGSFRSTLSPLLADWIKSNRIGMTLYYDAKLEASQAMRLKSMPAAVVIGADQTVQYAIGLGADKWKENLTAAVTRIVGGEKLADEMLRDYESFVSRYQRRMQLVSSEKLLGEPTDSNSRNASPKIVARTVWSCTELSRPGNLWVDSLSDTPKLFAFDGWQTIVEMDLGGHVLNRHKLAIPDGVGVSCLRICNSADGKRWYGLFSVLGTGVYVFDRDWQLVAQVHSDETNPDHLHDCQFETDLVDGLPILVVGFQNEGLRQFELGNKKWSDLSATKIESLTVSQDSIFGIEDSYLVRIPASGGKPDVCDLGASQTLRVAAIAGMPLGTDGCLVTGVSADGQWQLSSVNGLNQLVSHATIGPQLFDNEVEPYCRLANGKSGGILGWADSLGKVHLMTDQLNELGAVSTGDTITDRKSVV